MNNIHCDKINNHENIYNSMKLGFSTLALFSNTNDKIVETAWNNGFDMIELLAENPFNFNTPEALKSFEVYIHGPTVDLNIASINKGIKEESVRQMKNTIDRANEVNAKAITVHPGKIGRNDKRLRKIAIENAIESIGELVDYSDLTVSVENMPERFSFLANRIDELEQIREETGCMITIDTGHANTCENPEEFFDLKDICYFHLNDNNGEKDQHLTLGEGTLNLDLLKNVEKGIIELNNFDNILKSKKLIENI